MTPTSEAVTQADREAAAELIEATWSFPAQPAFDVRAGRSDDSVTVQAFARHRQSSAPKASPAPLEGVVEELRQARDLAMDRSVRARIPECGDFGGIAQTLDAALPIIEALSRAQSGEQQG